MSTMLSLLILSSVATFNLAEDLPVTPVKNPYSRESLNESSLNTPPNRQQKNDATVVYHHLGLLRQPNYLRMLPSYNQQVSLKDYTNKEPENQGFARFHPRSLYVRQNPVQKQRPEVPLTNTKHQILRGSKNVEVKEENKIQNTQRPNANKNTKIDIHDLSIKSFPDGTFAQHQLTKNEGRNAFNQRELSTHKHPSTHINEYREQKENIERNLNFQKYQKQKSIEQRRKEKLPYDGNNSQYYHRQDLHQVLHPYTAGNSEELVNEMKLGIDFTDDSAQDILDELEEAGFQVERQARGVDTEQLGIAMDYKKKSTLKKGQQGQLSAKYHQRQEPFSQNQEYYYSRHSASDKGSKIPRGRHDLGLPTALQEFQQPKEGRRERGVLGLFNHGPSTGGVHHGTRDRTLRPLVTAAVEVEEEPRRTPYVPREDYPHAYPRYTFAYTVDAEEYGVHNSHREERDGDITIGTYSVLDPDGYLRTVNYRVDEWGFNADVNREPVGQPQVQSPPTTLPVVTEPFSPRPEPGYLRPRPTARPAPIVIHRYERDSGEYDNVLTRPRPRPTARPAPIVIHKYDSREYDNLISRPRPSPRPTRPRPLVSLPSRYSEESLEYEDVVIRPGRTRPRPIVHLVNKYDHDSLEDVIVSPARRPRPHSRPESNRVPVVLHRDEDSTEYERVLLPSVAEEPPADSFVGPSDSLSYTPDPLFSTPDPYPFTADRSTVRPERFPVTTLRPSSLAPTRLSSSGSKARPSHGSARPLSRPSSPGLHLLPQTSSASAGSFHPHSADREASVWPKADAYVVKKIYKVPS